MKSRNSAKILCHVSQKSSSRPFFRFFRWRNPATQYAAFIWLHVQYGSGPRHGFGHEREPGTNGKKLFPNHFLFHILFHTRSSTRDLPHEIFHTRSSTQDLLHEIFHTRSSIQDLPHEIFHTRSSTREMRKRHVCSFPYRPGMVMDCHCPVCTRGIFTGTCKSTPSTATALTRSFILRCGAFYSSGPIFSSDQSFFRQTMNENEIIRPLLIGSGEHSRTWLVSTVTWLGFYSGATLRIRIFESSRMTQHSRNRVTSLSERHEVVFWWEYERFCFDESMRGCVLMLKIEAASVGV